MMGIEHPGYEKRAWAVHVHLATCFEAEIISKFTRVNRILVRSLTGHT